MSHPIKVDIWSDIQCPWCYIGKRKFEAALADTDVEVEVEYHSFELAPDTPVDFAGSPLDYLSERKGIAPAQAQTMIDRVVDIASGWDSTTTTRPSTRPTRCWRTSCCTWPRPTVARPS